MRIIQSILTNSIQKFENFSTTLVTVFFPRNKGTTMDGQKLMVLQLIKTFIADKATLSFHDGYVARTPQEFVDKIESEYQSSIANQENWGWRTVYAFSVHPKGSDDPAADNQDGQWVNAQFESADATYIEWYHIVDGKLKAWYQAKGNYTFSE